MPFSGVISACFSAMMLWCSTKSKLMDAYRLLLITLVWCQASHKQYPKVTNNCCDTAFSSYCHEYLSSQQRCQFCTVMTSLNSLAGEQSVQCCEDISRQQRVCHNNAVQKHEWALKRACSLFRAIFMKYSHRAECPGRPLPPIIQYHFPNKQTNLLLFSIRRLSCPARTLGFKE